MKAKVQILILVALLLAAFSSGEEPAKPTDLYGDPLPAGALKRFGTTRLRHAGMQSLAFLHDGKTLASLGVQARLRLWDLETGRELKSLLLSQPKQQASALGFSAEGRLVATTSSERGDDSAYYGYGDEVEESPEPEKPPTIRIWDAASGHELFQFAANQEGIGRAVFSPDAKRLAAVSTDKTIFVWEIATGKQISHLRGHRGNTNDLAFSADGQTLFTASEDKTIRAWDVATGRERFKLRGHGGGVSVIAVSRDGKLLASGGDGLDNSARLWDLATNKQLREWKGFTSGVAYLSFSPDGKLLASAGSSQDSNIRIWETSSGKEVRQIEATPKVDEDAAELVGFTGAVSALVFSPDGKLLASTGGYGDPTIRLWNLETGKQIVKTEGHELPVWSVDFSTDGKKLISTSTDQTWRLWDIESSKQLLKLKRSDNGDTAFAFSPDANTLATAGNDHVIRLTNIATGEKIAELKGHDQPVNDIEFSPDGKTIASNDGKGQWNNPSPLRLWDAASGKQTSALQGGQHGISSYAFSPDSKFIATVGRYQSPIQLWDVATGKTLLTIPTQYAYNAVLSFSPDGKTIALTDSNYQRVELFEVATGKLWLQMQLPYSQQHALAFSPDGQTLATIGVSSTSEIHLWHLGTGLVCDKIKIHGSLPTDLAFAPDGKTIAVGDSTGCVLLYPVPAAAPTEPDDLSVQQLDEYWTELAGDDAPLVFEAIGRLASGGDKAVAYLKEKLAPAPTDAEKIRKLIADLDNADFVLRDMAQKELAKLGLAAEATLREALEKTESAEVRDRARKLLEPLGPPFKTFPSEPLRQLRAIQALEWNRSAAARAALDELAAHAAHSTAGREAKVALDRLGKRPTK